MAFMAFPGLKGEGCARCDQRAGKLCTNQDKFVYRDRAFQPTKSGFFVQNKSFGCIGRSWTAMFSRKVKPP